MLGVPQIGDGNINYEYSPYMNNSYGNMQLPGSQLDMYNQFNVSAYNYNANNNSGMYHQSTSTVNFNNMNDQQKLNYPIIQNVAYQNASGGNINSINNKNVNSDPISDLFG
jgi:hypothetical protein